MIMYILLCGFPPFYGGTPKQILTQVRTKVVENSTSFFPVPEWASITAEAKQLVLAMLNRDPAARPTAAELLRHPWLCDNSNTAAIATIPRLKRFNAKVCTRPWLILRPWLGFFYVLTVPLRAVCAAQVSSVLLCAQGDQPPELADRIAQGHPMRSQVCAGVYTGSASVHAPPLAALPAVATTGVTPATRRGRRKSVR